MVIRITSVIERVKANVMFGMVEVATVVAVQVFLGNWLLDEISGHRNIMLEDKRLCRKG